VPVLEQVLDRYPHEVRLVFKNFPLRRHKFAMKAAMAAFAADNQGRFWDFHDQLFENFNHLNDGMIRKIVLEIGLNEAELKKQMRTRQVLSRVTKDIQEGNKAGVRSVPSVFINGRLLKNRSIKRFQAVIDKELKKLKKPK